MESAALRFWSSYWNQEGLLGLGQIHKAQGPALHITKPGSCPQYPIQSLDSYQE